MWYVVCGSKNEHPKDMYVFISWTKCPKYGDCSGFKVNVTMGGNLYDRLMSMEIFTLELNRILNMSFKNHEESGYSLALNLLTISY